MFNYSFEFYFAKNSFNILRKKIYLTKKYSDYLLVLRRHVLRETFYYQSSNGEGEENEQQSNRKG